MHLLCWICVRTGMTQAATDGQQGCCMSAVHSSVSVSTLLQTKLQDNQMHIPLLHEMGQNHHCWAGIACAAAGSI